MKKRAEKLVNRIKLNTDFPSCEDCGKELKIKLEAPELFEALTYGSVITEGKSLDDIVFYKSKEEGVFYRCDECDDKLGKPAPL